MKLVDRCPHCREDDLTHYYDSDEHESEDGWWYETFNHRFECDRCGTEVKAEERDGQWVPVVEEEED